MVVSFCFVMIGFLLSLNKHSAANAFGTNNNDRSKPHQHQGMLAPFQPDAICGFSATKEEEKVLANGKPVIKQFLSDSPFDISSSRGDIREGDLPTAGGVLCIQDVNAPLEAAWSQILDFNDYKSKVPLIKASQIYSMVEKVKDMINIKTHMVLSAMVGFTFEFFYDHTYYPDKSCLTWTLDYQKTSDFNDVIGLWHVQSLGDSKSRIFYAYNVQMNGPVPRPLLNYVKKVAPQTATAWVKRESEANPQRKAKLFMSHDTTTMAPRTVEDSTSYKYLRSDHAVVQQHQKQTENSADLAVKSSSMFHIFRPFFVLMQLAIARFSELRKRKHLLVGQYVLFGQL
ncbi:hypothetical protein ACA910_019344 [Epithemia clementina (nom. ined.)]